MAITSMNIALNQALMAFVAADMRENSYASLSEYLRALVRERRRQRDEEQLLAMVDDVRSRQSRPARSPPGSPGKSPKSRPKSTRNTARNAPGKTK